MKIVEPKIIKTGTCKSASGQSTLTYHIGKDQSGIHFRIYGNTGGGFFSKEWLSLKDIQEAISKSSKPFTSTVLHSLFHGKSINTPGFMLAVLLNEGLVKQSKRCYERIDPSAFMDSMVDVKAVPDAKPKNVTKRKPASKPKVVPKTTP